jgi:hypothetical protein
MVVPDHVGRLQVVVVNGVVLTYHVERDFIVEVRPLTAHLLVRLG